MELIFLEEWPAKNYFARRSIFLISLSSPPPNQRSPSDGGSSYRPVYGWVGRPVPGRQVTRCWTEKYCRRLNAPKIRSPHKAMAPRRFRRSGGCRTRPIWLSPTSQHPRSLNLSLLVLKIFNPRFCLSHLTGVLWDTNYDSTPIPFPCLHGRQPAGPAFEWSRARIAGCWFQPGYIAVP